MKTPEENKCGMECIRTNVERVCIKPEKGQCPRCKQHVDDSIAYIQQLESDNAAKQKRIEELESRLAQVEREMDVMRPVFIREMKKYGCTTCEHYIPAAYTQECLGCGNSELKHWTWNGVCPENTKEK